MFGAGALGVGEGLVIRREAFLAAGAASALLARPEAFDPEPVSALASESLDGGGPLRTRLCRLGPGKDLAELLPREARGGFLLDLDPPEWRSAWGGLLLFQDSEGRLHGYRPVPGALTLFRAEARPLVSLVMPGAPDRVSLLGWWDRARR